MHAEKIFSCGKCGKKFGLKDVCSRHEKECGKAFVCESCGGSFTSKNSLAKHLKRKGHQPTKPIRLENRIASGTLCYHGVAMVSNLGLLLLMQHSKC